MIAKIISGGQTGVDQGALDFAISRGKKHGGFCPKGRICENGTIPKKYSLKEVDSDDYHVRTRLNVQMSDGTLIILGSGFMEKGTVLTRKFCRELKKPMLLIKDMLVKDLDELGEKIKVWLEENKIIILNVAGNRESNAVGIQHKTKEILEKTMTDE